MRLQGEEASRRASRISSFQVEATPALIQSHSNNTTTTTTVNPIIYINNWTTIYDIKFIHNLKDRSTYLFVEFSFQNKVPNWVTWNFFLFIKLWVIAFSSEFRFICFIFNCVGQPVILKSSVKIVISLSDEKEVMWFYKKGHPLHIN